MDISGVKEFFYCICPRTLRSYWDQVQASNLGSRMAYGAFWSIGGALISRGLMLIASIFLARMLGREVFGEFGIIRSTVNMFLVFAGFGLGMTATKHVAQYRVTDPARAGRILALSGLFAIFSGFLVAINLYFFAPWVAAKTINAPHLDYELQIAALILFLNTLNGAQTGALAGFEAFKAIAKVNLGVGLVSFPLLVVGAYFGGLRGAVWALAANMFINWLLNHLALRREAARYRIPFTVKGCFVEWQILWHFSLPATLGGIMVSPVLWLCNAMLVNQPNGYGQMGLFDAANQWRMAILFIPGVVGQIVLPLLSNLNGTDVLSKYIKVLKWNAIINTGTAIVVALPIALSASFIMGSYGKGFEAGAVVLIVLALNSVIISLNNVVGQAIASKGNMWIGLLFNLMWAIVLIWTSEKFINKGYGAFGLAISTVVAYFFHSIWQAIYLMRLLRRHG